jgi:hypothetical protein
MAVDPDHLVRPGRQGTLRGGERGVGHMEVEARGAQAGVAEQQLDATQVDPGFEEVGGKSVPEQMRIHGLGDLGGVAGLGVSGCKFYELA